MSTTESLTSQALAQFSDDERAIAMVQEYGSLTVAVDGIGKVTEARKQVKRLRVGIEKRRKELNEDALSYQRTVNGEANRLKGLIEPIEAKLQAEEDNYEEERRKEREAKEAEKRAALNARLNRLGQAGVAVTDVASIETMDGASFEFHLLTESRKAEERRQEAEKQRLEAEEFAAQQRKEREELAAKMAAERAAIEAERAELRRQQEELQQAQAAKRREEEQRMREAAEAERKAAAEAREAAAKPELEKLARVLAAMAKAAGEETEALGRPWWTSTLRVQFETMSKAMASLVKGGVN